MAHDVFISYSSKNKAIADAVCAGLEAKKIRCWIAPRDILPGGNYGESIVQAMAASRVVVLVFSAATNASPAVLREMERAMHHGLPIIPFRLEDIAMSPGLEFFLASCHWLDAMQPPMEQHIAKLVSATQSLLGREADAVAAVSLTTAPRPKRLKYAILVGVVAVTAIAIGVVKLWKPSVVPVSTVTPVETGSVTMTLSVHEAGSGAITEHFQAAGPAEVRHVVEIKPDGSLKITDVCGYLDAWKRGTPLQAMTRSSQGFFHDTPVLLELKFLNTTDKTISINRAVAEVQSSESNPQPLLVIERLKGNQLSLQNIGTADPGPVSFQLAIAGQEDALDDAKLPAPVSLDLSNGGASFPLTQVPATGESTAFGQFGMGEGAARTVHRFEIPLGVKPAKTPSFPASPTTDYQLDLHEEGGPYEVECPLSQYIQKGEGDLFQIQINVATTSTHRFRLHLDYNDGGGATKELISPWIEASLFVENETQ